MTASKAERLADEELMPLIGDRDPDAFEVFYDRHGGVAYSLAYRIVGERGAAEDVTQEAFISLWRSGARYHPARGSVRSWMLGIVRNRAIDALRSRAGRAPKLDFDDNSILEHRPAEELTDNEALRRETAQEVRGALDELPGEQSVIAVAVVTAFAISGGGSGGGKTTTTFVGHSPGVTAEMVSSGESGTLHLANLHRLPPDKVLQAWVQRDKKVVWAKALFEPNSDGTASATIDDMNGVEVVMVTAEPHGGSVQPTSTPIVSVSIPN